MFPLRSPSDVAKEQIPRKANVKNLFIRWQYKVPVSFWITRLFQIHLDLLSSTDAYADEGGDICIPWVFLRFPQVCKLVDGAPYGLAARLTMPQIV